ncbi:MAG: hypothetical protein L0Y56_01875 [Nitrospira sp.]|nr:hypothetical protein [Nitrospira sp.]
MKLRVEVCGKEAFTAEGLEEIWEWLRVKLRDLGEGESVKVTRVGVDDVRTGTVSD